MVVCKHIFFSLEHYKYLPHFFTVNYLADGFIWKPILPKLEQVVSTFYIYVKKFLYTYVY